MMNVQRAKTNLKVIDDALEGGIPRGSIVLISGATAVRKWIIAGYFIHERLKAGDTGIFVTTDNSPERLKSVWKDYGWDINTFEESGYIKYLDAYTKSIGGTAFDNETTRYVENPQSLNEICIAVTELNEEQWNINPDVINVLDSGSTALLQEKSLSAVNYMIALMNKVKDTGAIFVVTLEEGMQDERIEHALRHAANIIFDLKKENDRFLVKVSGHDIKTSEWLPFEAGKSGFELVKSQPSS